MLRVDVYKNLRKDCWSVRSRMKGPNYGKVVAHLKQLALHNVHFKVSEPGRLRVLKSRQKNVHAVARGEWSNKSFVPGVEALNIYHDESKEWLDEIGVKPVEPKAAWKEIHYNPYKDTLFRIDEENIHLARYVVFAADGKAYKA